MSCFESLELARVPKGCFPTHGKFFWDCHVSTVLKEKIVSRGFRLRMINPSVLPLWLGKKAANIPIEKCLKKAAKLPSSSHALHPWGVLARTSPFKMGFYTVQTDLLCQLDLSSQNLDSEENYLHWSDVTISQKQPSSYMYRRAPQNTPQLTRALCSFWRAK